MNWSRTTATTAGVALVAGLAGLPLAGSAGAADRHADPHTGTTMLGNLSLTTVTLTGPRYRRGLNIPLTWETDSTDVASYDASYRGIPWDRPSALSTAWLSDTTQTGATLLADPGTNYCFTVQATDSQGTVGASDGTCAVTPVDDRDAVSSGFVERRGTGFFKGTFARASRKGSTITWRHGRAAYTALLIASGPGNGRIRVTFGEREPVVVNLQSATERLLRVKLIGDYGVLRSGPLTVTVLSSGKPVRIDGAYFARDADDEYP